MKLIFLDLDGVLVTRRPGVFEDRLLRNLQTVVQRTGADVVLSSDWRRHPSAREEARRMLATVGLRIIGSTPCLSPFIAQRPTEILQWKKEFMKRTAGSGDPITHWIAIDDRALLEERHGSYLKGHFVQTHPLKGLVEPSCEECVRLLNSEPPAGSVVASESNDVDFDCSVAGARGTSPPHGAKFRGNSAGANVRTRGVAATGPVNSMAGAAAAAAALAGVGALSGAGGGGGPPPVIKGTPAGGPNGVGRGRGIGGRISPGGGAPDLPGGGRGGGRLLGAGGAVSTNARRARSAGPPR